jgi:hypothetical protein
MAAHDALDDALDKVRADAPGPWDVETVSAATGWPDGMEMIRQVREAVGLFAGAMPITPQQAWQEALETLDRLTALAEERLAGLDRLRVECEAWQTASAGWQARCSELEGLLGEAGVRRDQYKTMYYHLRERLERAEAMRGESTPTG